MINLPVFPVKTPHAFYDQLFACSWIPPRGNRTRLRSKLFSPPIRTWSRLGPSSAPIRFLFGFANTNGLNTFRFVNDAADSTVVRWSMVPVDAFQPSPSLPNATGPV